jgi:hypothetical protein
VTAAAQPNFEPGRVYRTRELGQWSTNAPRLTFGGLQFLLRRVAFPETPSPEWFVVDLFENAEQAAASRVELRDALEAALRAGKFDRDRLASMATRYGSRRTQALVKAALVASAR